MKFVRYFGLGLMVAFALGAVAASSASAGELLALTAKGVSAAGVWFLSLGGLAALTTLGGKEIHCEHVHNHGLFLTSTLGDILVRFLECTSAGASCKSLGAAAGEIHLPLATTLFHLGLAHLTLTLGKIPAVLILLDKDVHIECGVSPFTILVLVLGAVIGALQLDPSETQIPLNTPISTAILNFQQTANGLQHLRLFLLGGSLVSYDLDAEIGGAAAELSAEVSLDLLDLFLNSAGEHVKLELVEHP